MRDFLRQRNDELGRQVGLLLRSIEEAQVPKELELYRLYVMQVCQALLSKIRRNLALLQLGQSDILDELLGETTEVTWCFRLLSGQFSVPVLRASQCRRALQVASGPKGPVVR